MTARPAICCTILFALVSPSAWCCDPPAQNSFAAAEIVPADVTTYINITHGAELRKALAPYPVGRWITRWTVSPDLAKAWHALSESAHLSSGELFDLVLGAQFTLVVRGSGAGAEWTIISHVDAERAKTLLKSLAPRVVDYLDNIPIFDLPEHQLIVARQGDTLLIGPRGKNARLFASVCKGLADDCDAPLADDEAFEEAAAQGDGSLFAFVRQAHPRRRPPQSSLYLVANRHGEDDEDRPDDWVAFTGSLDGNTLTVHHASSKPMVFAGQDAVAQAWDMAPIKALSSDHNVLALIKPIAQKAGFFELVVNQGLGEANLRLAVTQQKSGRRILVLGDSMDSLGGAMKVPVVGQALEIDCNDLAMDTISTTMRDTNARIMNLDRGAYLTQSDAMTTYKLATVQAHDDLGNDASSTFRGLPVMEPMPLQWTVLNTPNGNWCVVSNDPHKLAAIAKALSSEDDSDPSYGSWLSCGSGDGRKLADTLRELTNSCQSMPAEFKGLLGSQAFSQIADLADVVDRFRWSLAKDEDGGMSLDVVLNLARNDTYEGQPLKSARQTGQRSQVEANPNYVKSMAETVLLIDPQQAQFYITWIMGL